MSYSLVSDVVAALADCEQSAVEIAVSSGLELVQVAEALEYLAAEGRLSMQTDQGVDLYRLVA